MSKNQPAAPAWTQHLCPGIILLFRFPERHDDLGGKKRPCLVLATRSQPDGLHVSLAYGTSVDNHANRGFDISVEADDCASVYVDFSKNGSKRYCDTGNCGNRMNVIAYRRRKAEESA